MLFALAVTLLSTTARAQDDREIAVVPLRNSLGDATDAADQVRSHLRDAGARILPKTDTIQRLLGPRTTGSPVDTAAAQRSFQQVNNLMLNERFREAYKSLEATVTALENDPQPSAEKTDILREARIRMALVALNEAGSRETGQANTEQGRLAQQALARVVMLDPAFSLDVGKYPPRLRLLLDRARADTARRPRAAVEVESHPSGANVFLEGRLLGQAPLKLASVAPTGTYRVWAEYQGRRSNVRSVELRADDVTRVSIDLVLEGMLRSADGSVEVLPSDVEDTAAPEIAAALAVRMVAFVARRPGTLGVMLYDADRGLVVRRGETADNTPDATKVLARLVSPGVVGSEVQAFAADAADMGLPQQVAFWATGAQAAAADAARGASVALAELSAPEVQLASRDVLERCRSDVACMLAALGKDGAQRAVQVEVMPGRPLGRVEAALFDVQSGQELRRVTLRFAEGTASEGARNAVWRLVRPSGCAGAVTLQSPRDGLNVLWDGVPLGQTPLVPLQGVPAGRHVLRVMGTGLTDAEMVVEVPLRAEATVTVQVEAERIELLARKPAAARAATTETASPVATEDEEPRPRRPVWALAVAGAGAVGCALLAPVGLAALATGIGGTAWSATFQRDAQGGVVLEEGETLEQAQRRIMLGAGIAGGGFLGAGAVALAATGALAVVAAGIVLFLVLRV
ncbi:MAG: PEGA domain-containing protein [Deltaproteobacteria bacterium]|nr:PEGA domain-containing protein [Deltaproteobacteria bacterium]